MPKGRKPKPARLWFREDEQQWCILDRGKQIRTGLRRDEIQAAEERFAEYVGDKRTIVVTERDPARLAIADVILSYEQGKRPRDFDELVAREKGGEQLPIEQKKRLERHKELAYRLDNINTFFGARTIADIRKQLCGDYVDWRTHTPNDRAATFPQRLARAVSDQSARRELEDLRAAIGAWHAENMLTMVPVVSLPPKSEARKAWLTRSMAARLLGAALGFTFDQEGRLRHDGAGRIIRRDRVTRTRRRHAARFILIALYSGRREETARRTLWHATPTNPSFDLDRMVYHGRGVEELKTKKRRPPAKIATRLRPHLLRWHQLDRKLEGELLGRGLQQSEAQVSHVIHRPDGRPLRGKIKTAWSGILEDAALADEADKVVRHTLKHTAATWLMQAGTDRWQAAGFLGITVEQLEDGYGHHHPDFQDAAAAAFSPKRQA
jgi:hypothetical protein